MFGAVKEIRKTLFPGDKHFKEFSHAHNAPASPDCTQDKLLQIQTDVHEKWKC